ncbi:urease accessory protein UreF [Gordonia sp. (in: high G+C Gram-positive bacteria)]|uniref:urease accessory protein UreF n=1 Tax=Gordonia sp. (in: high G+C Gram-positive bacteria) TaxID=84139 RepID=UPI003F9D7E23
MTAPTQVAMLLADARLPTGGHAYSAGMEPALTGGMPPDHVRDLLCARAQTTSQVEAGTAVLARHRVLSGESLQAVQDAWAARTPSPAVRTASIAHARGYLRLARRIWPAVDSGALPETPCRAVVLGAIAATAALPATDLVRLVIYDEAATAAAALLKLDPRDPAEATGWILDACAAAESTVAQIAAVTDPAAVPASGAPHSEQWAQTHARLTQRLFRA